MEENRIDSGNNNPRRIDINEWNNTIHEKKVLWDGLKNRTTYYIFLVILILFLVIYFFSS